MKKLSVIACVALAAAFSALAVGLRIFQQSGQIAVAWPTQAVNFTLESTTNLAGELSWQKVASATTVAGTNYVVALPAPEASQFFRLRKTSGASPVIANVQAPASLAFGDSITATFDYVEPSAMWRSSRSRAPTRLKRSPKTSRRRGAA